MSNNYNQDKGSTSERAVGEYLVSRGYKILERNYKYGKKEVDIIAEKDDTVCFVEVKSRTSEKYGKGFESVNLRKMRNIIEVARVYIARGGYKDKNIRFDVASVDCGTIEYFENAFNFFQ